MKRIRLALFLTASLLPMTAHAQSTIEQAFSRNQGATALIVKTIGEAHRTVHLAAYYFTSRPIADALIAARQRGVEVDVVMDKSQNESRYTAAALLAENGVPVRINSQYAIMHDKFIIIDGTTLETGSFNFTEAAEKRNAENVLVLHDNPQVTSGYEEQWQKLWNEGQAQ